MNCYLGKKQQQQTKCLSDYNRKSNKMDGRAVLMVCKQILNTNIQGNDIDRMKA